MVKRRRGFSLVEVMFVVSLIGMIGSIFVVELKRYRRAVKQNAIMANLRVVEDAKAMCVAEKGVKTGDTTLCSNSVLTAEYLKGAWPAYVDRHGGPVGSISTDNKLEANAVGTAPTYRGYPYEWWADSANMDWILQ